MSLQQLLGVEKPLIQAPMAGVQDSALAIAVAQAGALGSLPCAMLSLDTMRSEFERIRSQTSRPFNANFFCHSAPAPQAAREAMWQTLLGRYYTELNVDASKATKAPTRQPFNRDMAELVCAYRPGVVSFHFGLPAPDLLAMVKGSGAKVLSSATTLQEALWLQEQGVDAVIAQGAEAGGHRGMFLSQDLATQIPLDALLPQLLAALRIPVIAAGGIASARDVKAVLAKGAVAAQVGTAYLLCPEATTSRVHRTALKSEAARDTVLTNVFTGRPARGIVNRMVRELGPMNLHAPQFPLASSASLPLRQKAESQGSGDFSPLWSGQNTSGCREIPAAQLTLKLLELI